MSSDSNNSMRFGVEQSAASPLCDELKKIVENYENTHGPSPKLREQAKFLQDLCALLEQEK